MGIEYSRSFHSMHTIVFIEYNDLFHMICTKYDSFHLIEEFHFQQYDRICRSNYLAGVAKTPVIEGSLHCLEISP